MGMSFREFWEWKEKMCGFYNNGDYKECPMYKLDLSYVDCFTCNDAAAIYPKIAEEVVEKWSKEHSELTIECDETIIECLSKSEARLRRIQYAIRQGIINPIQAGKAEKRLLGNIEVLKNMLDEGYTEVEFDDLKAMFAKAGGKKKLTPCEIAKKFGLSTEFWEDKK